MKRILAFLLLFGFLFASPTFAQNKIYIAPESAHVWTVGGGDETLDMGGLAADAVDMGSYADLGSASRSEWYTWEMFIDGFDTAPVVGEAIELFFSMGTSTTVFAGRPTTAPGDTSEGTMTENQSKNCIFSGVAIVVSTTAGDNLQASGVVRLPLRYVSPVVHNNTADALLSTADGHVVTLTPIPSEVQ